MIVGDHHIGAGIPFSNSAPQTGAFPFLRWLLSASLGGLPSGTWDWSSGSISISDFDTHSNNFPRLKKLLPIVDHGLATLVADLDERGMLDDVSIVAWGEFGRTPTVDAKNGGRHHWPAVGMALLAGGGMHAGQVIGQSDRYAAAAISRPVHYQDVFATLYHNLGINARGTTVTDPSGRPQYLLERGDVLSELV
jgi:hypothetical protein